MKIRHNIDEKASKAVIKLKISLSNIFLFWISLHCFPQWCGESFSLSPAFTLKWHDSFCYWSWLKALKFKMSRYRFKMWDKVLKKVQNIHTEFRNIHDPLLIWMASHTHSSPGARKLKGWKVCVGVSVCLCGWMMISAVLLSNQQLLIHLTEQINKASYSWGVCVWA